MLLVVGEEGFWFEDALKAGLFPEKVPVNPSQTRQGSDSLAHKRYAGTRSYTRSTGATALPQNRSA